jgi:hypothetical protein
MFTLSTSSGQAVINGFGQVKVFASAEQAEAYAEASEELRGQVKPREVQLVESLDA